MELARLCDSVRPCPSRLPWRRGSHHGARHRHHLAAIAASLVFPSVTILAQSPGNLQGVVSDAEKKPLPHARISVAGTDLVTVSDSEGTFGIAALPLGPQTIEVKLLGYQSASLPVQITAGSDARLLVILTAVPSELQTVKVLGDTIIIPEMRGFMERKARGSGKFFTRDEIDKMAVRVFTDVLRRVPGMQLEAKNSEFGTRYSVESARTQGVNGGRGCEVLYFVNGVAFPIMGNMEINSYIRPDDIAAVEIYNGVSQIPPQFNSGSDNARCGVVVIWTRVGKAARN